MTSMNDSQYYYHYQQQQQQQKHTQEQEQHQSASPPETTTTTRSNSQTSPESSPTSSSPSYTYMMSSLLAKALEVPALVHPNQGSSGSIDQKDGGDDIEKGQQQSNGNVSASTGLLGTPRSKPRTFSANLTPQTANLYFNQGGSLLGESDNSMVVPSLPGSGDEEALLPQHSDFTIPTSNAQQYSSKTPPLQITPSPNQRALLNGGTYDRSTTTAPTNSSGGTERRSVFGQGVDKRYAVSQTTALLKRTNAHNGDVPASTFGTTHVPPVTQVKVMSPPHSPVFANGRSYHDASYNHHHHHQQQQNHNTISPLTPAFLGGTTPNLARGTMTPKRLEPIPSFQDIERTPPRLTAMSSRITETIHAQSLMLGIAFMAVWTANNAMAPNLTQIAESFGMEPAERDLYLGSYCALAVGVFSLPISALIGFMADFYSRKHLYVACVLGGSLASACTGWSTNFTMLFLARLVNGGCMSGSVPVAFSLLGDLFSTEERNAASSALTSMMGCGILFGQVYAGVVGPSMGWEHPFFVSSGLTLVTAVMVLMWVREPDRGAKEKALQDMLEAGNKYERKLTLAGFIHAMRQNESNVLLLWQGFFTSLPWGVVFVFLNDYLSQEKGFSVPDATFMVMLFGIGCAIGGILGGYFGQKLMGYNRSYLPLFMAGSTFMGIFPFLGLLNSSFPNHHGYKAMAYSILGGTIAALPSVNVRPCIINVNPPETRGAALTAANLLIALGRGIGPSCITAMVAMFQVSRQTAFNVTLTGFWTITAIQLLFLASALPKDQDKMEAELARYVDSLKGGATYGSINSGGDTDEDDEEEEFFDAYQPGQTFQQSAGTVYYSPHRRRGSVQTTSSSPYPHHHHHYGTLPDELAGGEESIVSIEEYMTSFDGIAARRSFQFVQKGIREIKHEIAPRGFAGCGGGTTDVPSSDSEPDEETAAIANAAAAAAATATNLFGTGDGNNDESLGSISLFDDNNSLIVGSVDTGTTSNSNNNSNMSMEEIDKRRDVWKKQQQQQLQEQIDIGRNQYENKYGYLSSNQQQQQQQQQSHRRGSGSSTLSGSYKTTIEPPAPAPPATSTTSTSTGTSSTKNNKSQSPANEKTPLLIV